MRLTMVFWWFEVAPQSPCHFVPQSCDIGRLRLRPILPTTEYFIRPAGCVQTFYNLIAFEDEVQHCNTWLIKWQSNVWNVTTWQIHNNKIPYSFLSPQVFPQNLRLLQFLTLDLLFRFLSRSHWPPEMIPIHSPVSIRQYKDPSALEFLYSFSPMDQLLDNIR